jgi:hypothetical protein
MASDAGEGELDGAGQKRVWRLFSSTSHHPFLQRRPDTVAPLRTQNLSGVDGYGYGERDGEGESS